jgi:5-methylcytosine-specific restriction enzyme A
MPYKPKRPCAYPLCPNFAEEGSSYCSAHKQSLPQDSRASSAKRGYDRHWQKLRVMHLREFPLCEMCRAKGVIRQAELVHHIKSVITDLT